MRITITACCAGAGGVKRPCRRRSSNEKRVGSPVGIDLRRRLRLGADQVEPAGDPLWTSASSPSTKVVSTGHQPPPAASQAVFHGLDGRTAHPLAVERHDAVAVFGMDERLDRAAEQRVARHAGQLGDERRGIRNDPAASWTETSARTLVASMRKRLSQGSEAMPLPSPTALR